jgi:hypothetical protein
MWKNRSQTPPSPAVCVTLVLERSTADDLDAAARMLGVDRQEVLLRGLDLLTVATAVVCGHSEHVPPGVSSAGAKIS